MLLYEPNPTQFDLRFRLFGVDVRVHPFFWLMSVILGWNLTRNPVLPGNGMAELGLWILATFISILLHEFGHIWMGQVFHSHGHIVLHGMGGLAIGSNAVPYRWQRILVSVAGPAIQLVLWVALYGMLRYGVLPLPALQSMPALRFFLVLMLWINLYWPLLNLLPIWPLDGGQISREVCTGVSPRNGQLVSLWLSLVLSAVIAVNALVGDQPNMRAFLPYAPVGMWATILFALLAVGAWQAIQLEQARRQSYYDDESDDRLPWER